MEKTDKSLPEYKTGDFVVYKSGGICEITDIRRESFAGGGAREYYILRSVFDPRSQIYVPVGSELSLRMRRVLGADELNALICAPDTFKLEWLDDAKERSAEFLAVLERGDCREIFSLYRLITRHKKELEQDKKQLHASDSRVLAHAEKTITEEYAYVLGIRRDEVVAYIEERLGTHI